MGWSLGYDDHWQRWVGYSVPAFCDHPGCYKEIDRGISYVCGGELFGGEDGCGLHFCGDHLVGHGQRCACCAKQRQPFAPKAEHPKWLRHLLNDESWQEWRDQNPDELRRIRVALTVPTEQEARAEFERQNAGRNFMVHHLRGTYISAPIAALWNQHLRTLKWMRDLAEQNAIPNKVDL